MKSATSSTRLPCLPWCMASAERTRSNHAWNAALAFEAGNLRGRTAPLGLSLGDRFCLALAHAMRVPAVTADQAWRKLAPDPQCLCIRE